MAKAKSTNSRKSRVQKPDTDKTPITVEALAALEFEASEPIPELERLIGAEQWRDLGTSVRLAYATLLRSKTQLIDMVHEMGVEETQELVETFQTVQERLEGFGELANTAEIRLMVALAVVGFEQPSQ